MGEAPQPQRRLSWPALRQDHDSAPDAADPEGTWLAGSAPGQPDGSETPPTFDWLFRDPRRWAPQHGPAGREPAAVPALVPPPRPAAPALPPAEAAPAAPPRPSRLATVAREILETALLAVLVFLAVRASVQHYRVDGSSMEPTLEDGEFLLVNSLAYSRVDVAALARWVPGWAPGPPAERYLFGGPQRGDIVVFHHPSGVHRDLVKRVIGLPGETVEIRQGTVYIDGRALVEPYLAAAEPPIGDMAPVRIPADAYFVMGDNRNHSQDSRVLGPIPADRIVGKAFITWWPRDRFGPAPNEAPRFAAAEAPAPE
ncbi:signal peptidase I [Tepidiforma sp.]|uniref:signal peptidase I n=1 Tax=Tepidiforma sp. TaxID=2682230 RepID=UPI00262CB4B6|nr:signal peptidase I [Tepidiforma sp.]